ncbi:MAG: phage portal protein [Actinomycetota bacterium]
MTDYFRGCTYDEIYRCQPSVRKVIDRRAVLQSLVPFKAFERTGDGREEVAASRLFGRLVRTPCPTMSQRAWLDWKRKTKDIHGTAFSVIAFDVGGKPMGLDPIHPMRIRFGKDQRKSKRAPDRSRMTLEERETGRTWWFVVGPNEEIHFPRRELFVWKTYNPSDPNWGLSKLEALRGTLEDDAAARAAMEALWKRGARPHYVIQSKDNMSNHPAVVQQIKDDAEQSHGGVGNWWRPLVLDEGMDIKELRFESGLEYLGLRKVTDQEVGAVYDLSGAANHDHEHSTFTNAREVLRDSFRTSMASELQSFEAAFEHDVRDGRHGDTTRDPNFASTFYAEHVLEGILKGSPEEQIDAAAKQLQTGQLTINEWRAKKNMPSVEGGDVPLVNGALVPLTMAGQTSATAPAPEIDLPDPSEALALSAGTGGGLTGHEAVSTVMGRLGRLQQVPDLDVPTLVADLSEGNAQLVRRAVAAAFVDNWEPKQLRDLIRRLEFD